MLRMLVDSESGWVPEQIVLAHGSKSLNSDWTELVSFRRSGLVPIAQQSSLTSEASPVIPTTYMLVCDWSNINGPFHDRWSAHELRRMKDETSGTTIRYPASACSAFAIVSINNLAGLGHRVWDIVLGVIFSLSARTPFRLDVSRLEGTGDHGRYDFLVSGGFLPLDEVFITKHEIKMFFPGSDRNVKLDNDKFEEVVFRRQNVTLECNKTSRFFTDRLCNDDWCFMDTFHGRTQDPHQLARPFFTQAMQRSRFLALRDLRPRNSLVCMWHIRTGDIALGNSTAFQTNLVGLLARVLKGTSIVVYIATTEETFAVKEALALCDRHGLNAQVLLEDLPTTLHGMIHADVLIHCGSSLTHVAALCSPSTLHLLPQEKDNPSTELPKFLDGSFHLENNGRLHEPEEQLRAKLLENYEAIVRTEWI